MLGPAETDAAWQNMLCLFLSKVVLLSTINVCVLGRIRRTGREENKGFVWLGGLFGNYISVIKSVPNQARNEQGQTRISFPTYRTLTSQHFLASRQTRIGIRNISSLEVVSSQQGEKAQKKKREGNTVPFLTYGSICVFAFSSSVPAT